MRIFHFSQEHFLLVLNYFIEPKEIAFCDCALLASLFIRG